MNKIFSINILFKIASFHSINNPILPNRISRICKNFIFLFPDICKSILETTCNRLFLETSVCKWFSTFIYGVSLSDVLSVSILDISWFWLYFSETL
jgi:hypothetical protein